MLTNARYLSRCLHQRSSLIPIDRKYFDDSREPFTLTIAGAELYIITNPQDMSLVYKSTESLAFDDFIRDLHVGFGMSAYGRETMWDDTAGKCLVHQANDIHHAQLHPGEHLDDLTQKFLGQIERRLRPDMVFPGKDSRNSGTPKQARLSLYDLCSDVLVPEASVALFGEALLRTSPTLVDDFHSFDEDSWMLTYQYPPSASQKDAPGHGEKHECFYPLLSAASRRSPWCMLLRQILRSTTTGSFNEQSGSGYHNSSVLLGVSG